MRRLTIDKICDAGVANVAGAVLATLCRSYIAAKNAYERSQTMKNKIALEKEREILLTTPWNFTGMSGTELIQSIEREDRRRKERIA